MISINQIHINSTMFQYFIILIAGIIQIYIIICEKNKQFTEYKMSNKRQTCFDFLKGKDPEFESSMNAINGMYDNLFSGDKLDAIFKNLAVDNNPVLEPIDDMSQDIFQSEQASGPKYVKENIRLKKNGDFDDEEDIMIIGEPVNGYPVHPQEQFYSGQQPNYYVQAPVYGDVQHNYQGKPIKPQPQRNPYYNEE